MKELEKLSNKQLQIKNDNLKRSSVIVILSVILIFGFYIYGTKDLQFPLWETYPIARLMVPLAVSLPLLGSFLVRWYLVKKEIRKRDLMIHK